MKYRHALTTISRTIAILAVLCTAFIVRSMPDQQLDSDDIYRPPPVWSGNGQLLAVANGSDAVIWNTETQERMMTLTGHTDTITAISWGPNDETIATGSRDRSAKVWIVSDGMLLHDLTGHREIVTALAWSPDGQTLVTGTDPDGGHGIYVWDTETGDLLAMFGASAPSLAYSPNGDFIAGGGSRVTIWDASTLEAIAQLSYPEATNNYMTTLAWSSDGQRLVTGSMDGSVLVWDIASAKEILFFEGSPAYQRSAAHSGAVTIPYAQLQYTWIRDVSFSADGEQVFSAAADGTVQAWDLTTGERVASATLDPLGAAAWNEVDGRLAYLPPMDEATREDGAVPIIVSPFE